jgi:hypothetical protein
MQDTTINYTVVKKLVDTWPKRAGVRSTDYYKQNNATEYDANISDYPIEMLPFYNHPRFIDATPKQQQEILTWAWLVYNERVVTAEECVANPAFTMIIQGVFPGADKYFYQQALQQCLIDEHFHTLIHRTAIHQTKKLRNINTQFHSPPSIIYRKLLENKAQFSEKWQKDLLTLVWTVVSEISINAYLNLLSTNKSIQPMHKTVTWLHNCDEFAHSSILIEITKSVYIHLNLGQKRFFISALPKAINAFAAHDFSSWQAILKHVGLTDYSKLIKDCEADTANIKLVRDFSGLKRLAEELDIFNEINFEMTEHKN